MIRRLLRAYVQRRSEEAFREERSALFEIIGTLQDRVMELEDNAERLKGVIKDVIADTTRDSKSRLWTIEGIVSRS